MNNTPRDIIFRITLKFLESDISLKLIIDYYTCKKNNFTKRDISFINNVSKGIIRFKSVLDYNIFKHSKQKTIDNKTLSLLYLGLYQIIYCDSIPNYASVNTTIDLAKIKSKKSKSFINAILRKNDKNFLKIDSNSSYDKLKKISFGYRKWQVNKLIKDYGIDKTRQFLIQNLNIPKIWIRINTLKTTKENIEEILITNKIDYKVDKFLEYFLLIEKFDRKNIIKKLIEKGLIYIQNPSSGHVVNILDIKPEMSVLDACSAPGGKASLISQITKNNVELTCIDNNESRLLTLKNNLSKMNCKNISFINCDSSTFSSEKLYDIILIDAPCSSFGTVKKNPDIKWRLTEKKLKNNIETQFKILNNLKKYVKINGYLIYSTCSIFNDENENNIIKFLNENGNFNLSKDYKIPSNFKTDLGAMKIFPIDNEYEGMFASRLKRYD